MKSPTAFRTISEVAEDLNVPQHVLRFWETRFTQIKPLKRQGGRRYYRPEDVRLLRGIRYLLYGEGYRIDGVQKLLKERGAAFVSAAAEQSAGEAAEPASPRADGDGSSLVSPPFAPEPDDRAPASSASDGAAHAAAEEPRASTPSLPDESRLRLEAALAMLDAVKRLLDEAAGTESDKAARTR